jgi:hypothetical protein
VVLVGIRHRVLVDYLGLHHTDLFHSLRRKKKMNWLVQLCLVEMMVAGFAMMIGYKPVGVFMIAMAAQSAYFAGRT